MKIEVRGTEYSGWTSASATINLDTLSNKFSFKVTSEEGKALPFKGGEPCTVRVDGELVLTGNIEVVTVGGDGDSHTISITGRDRTGDVVDSKIGSLSDIRPPITLTQVIELLLVHIKSPLKVVEQTWTKAFQETEDLASPEFGQSVWDFIQGLARKRQVLLTSDAYGNIVITRAAGEFIEATIQNKVKSDSNNVLDYSVSYDTTGIYSIYRAAGQESPVSINDGATRSNYSIVEQISAIQDPNIRLGRQLCVMSEKSGSHVDLTERNKWEYNIRQARSRVYSATVHGFRNQTGSLWAINKTVSVNDEFAGINARMLINSVKFSISDSGKETVLSLVNKDSYTLELPTQTSIDQIGLKFAETPEKGIIFVENPDDPEDLFGPGR